MEIKTKHMAARILDDYRLGMKDQDALYESLEMGVGALIREHERENPEPLTLEQLREMRGEPVCGTHCGKPDEASWFLTWDGTLLDKAGYRYYIGNMICGGWRFYAHKPSGEVQRE